MPLPWYHATFHGKAPHEYDQPSFHVGTPQAAFKRIQDLYQANAVPLVLKGAMFHMYEVSPDAPVGSLRRDAFMHPDSSGHPFSQPTARIRKIQPYVNDVEDSGEDSLLIPTSFVRKGHVRYRGSQFVDIGTIAETYPHQFHQFD